MFLFPFQWLQWQRQQQQPRSERNDDENVIIIIQNATWRNLLAD